MRLTDMKNFLAVSLLVLIAMIFVPGCTLPDNTAENSFRIRESWNMDAKLFVEDFNELMLLDRPSHLTYWYKHFGDY